MNKEKNYTPNQTEAYRLYSLINNNIESLNFILDYYEPKNDIKNEIVYFDRIEQEKNRESTFFKGTVIQFILKKAFESSHINEIEFERFIKKFNIQNEKFEIFSSKFNYSVIFDNNEVDFKNQLIDTLERENNLRNNKKLKEKELEDFCSIGEIEPVNIFLSSIQNSNYDNLKIKKLLIFFKKFNIQIPEKNYFAQNAFTHIKDPDLIEEYKKHVKINLKNLNLFDYQSITINDRKFKLNSSFHNEYERTKNRFLNTFDFLITNSTYENTEQKFNHIRQILKQAKKSSINDMGVLFHNLVEKLNLEKGEYEKLEEKYLKFAIKENYYIKDIVEISKSIYKKQKTHLFTIDGDYFYTLALASPKFFNSSFNKLKDDVKLQLLNSNLNGKNIFNQLFCMHSDYSYIDSSNIEFILNKFDINHFKNDQKFLKTLLNIYSSQAFFDSYFASNYNLFNTTDDFINYCKDHLKIKNKQYIKDFFDFAKKHNLYEYNEVEKKYNNSANAHSSYYQEALERTVTPFAFLNYMNYQEQTVLEHIKENKVSSNFFNFFMFLGETKKYSNDYFKTVCIEFLKKKIDYINEENNSLTINDLNHIVVNFKFIIEKNFRLDTQLLKQLQKIIENDDSIMNNLKHYHSDYKNEIENISSIIEKHIFDNEIKNIDVKPKSKFKI